MIFEFPRDQLLASIRANRDRHTTELKEALAGWRAEVIEQIDKERAELAALRKRAKASTLRPRDIRHGWRFESGPNSYAADYDVAISMLEMTNADVVALNETDFARYVKDQWDWRSQFDDYLESVRSKSGYRPRRDRRA